MILLGIQTSTPNNYPESFYTTQFPEFSNMISSSVIFLSTSCQIKYRFLRVLITRVWQLLIQLK